MPTTLLIKHPRNMTRAEFVALYGQVYEHSPWISEQVYDLKLHLTIHSCEKLSETLHKQLLSASYEMRLGVIRAHPDLADKLGKASFTAFSAEEQARSGLDSCSAEEFDEFARLNAEYKKKFDFPFIFAVRGSTREKILAAFRKRIHNTRAQEMDFALENIKRISYTRLRRLSECDSHDR